MRFLSLQLRSSVEFTEGTASRIQEEMGVSCPPSLQLPLSLFISASKQVLKAFLSCPSPCVAQTVSRDLSLQRALSLQSYFCVSWYFCKDLIYLFVFLSPLL